MTAANATSYRRHYRYANELRRYSQTARWQTVAFPKAPVLRDLSMLAGGIVKVLLDRASGYNKGTSAPQVEWSLDGSTGWTGVAVTGFTAGSDLITTAAVAAGVKFFRVRWTNTFGSGAYSNSKSGTVLA